MGAIQDLLPEARELHQRFRRSHSIWTHVFSIEAAKGRMAICVATEQRETNFKVSALSTVRPSANTYLYVLSKLHRRALHSWLTKHSGLEYYRGSTLPGWFFVLSRKDNILISLNLRAALDKELL